MRRTSRAPRACHPVQAAARAKQAEVPTQPDPSDPLGSQYGDAKLVRSESISGRKWVPIDTLTPELRDQNVSTDDTATLPSCISVTSQSQQHATKSMPRCHEAHASIC